MANRTTKTVSAFTIAELLIALAITGLLLAALAVAFNASVKSFQTNRATLKALNDARQALLRMTSQLRTGWCVDPNAPGGTCSFFTSANEDITYEFRNTDNKLYLITNSDGQEYSLCDNVIAATFTKTPTDDGSDCKSVQISLTIQSGSEQHKLCAAVVVRRTLGQ
jgi:type II secretory pathway pseudopilin PulG